MNAPQVTPPVGPFSVHPMITAGRRAGRLRLVHPTEGECRRRILDEARRGPLALIDAAYALRAMFTPGPPVVVRQGWAPLAARILTGLVRDGLMVRTSHGAYRLAKEGR